MEHFRVALVAVMPLLLLIGAVAGVIVCVGWPRNPFRGVYGAALGAIVAGAFGLAVAAKRWDTRSPPAVGLVIVVAVLAVGAVIRSAFVPGPLTGQERAQIAAILPADRRAFLGEDE